MIYSPHACLVARPSQRAPALASFAPLSPDGTAERCRVPADHSGQRRLHAAPARYPPEPGRLSSAGAWAGPALVPGAGRKPPLAPAGVARLAGAGPLQAGAAA